MALAKQTVKAGKHIQIFVRSNGKIVKKLLKMLIPKHHDIYDIISEWFPI